MSKKVEQQLQEAIQLVSTLSAIAHGEPMVIVVIQAPVNGGAPEILSNVEHAEQRRLLQFIVKNWSTGEGQKILKETVQ